MRPLHCQAISRILAGQPITKDERSGIYNQTMSRVYEKSQQTFEEHVHFKKMVTFGYRLFEPSQNEFEDQTKWEKLIAVLAFSTKLINRGIRILYPNGLCKTVVYGCNLI